MSPRRCSDCGQAHERTRSSRCAACALRAKREQIRAWCAAMRKAEKRQNPILCCECGARITDRPGSAKRCWPCNTAHRRNEQRIWAARSKARRRAATRKQRGLKAHEAAPLWQALELIASGAADPQRIARQVLGGSNE